MNILKIKKQATIIYKQNKKQIIPQFFLVGYVSLLAQYLQSGLFSFFVSLFLSPVAHGYVICSMKCVDDERVQLSYQDAVIGFTDFVRLAPVYLAKKFIIILCMIICALPLLFIGYFQFSLFSLEWVEIIGSAMIYADFLIPHFELVPSLMHNVAILLVILVCAFVYLYMSTLLTPLPYIVEEDDFSWNEALITSVKLMKGHIISYFMLYMTFIIRRIFYWGITGTVLLVVGGMNEILFLLCMVGSLFFYIDVYKGRYEISKYLFVKEMRGMLK